MRDVCLCARRLTNCLAFHEHMRIQELYLGFSTAHGTNISSNEMPPCWKVWR